MTSSVSQKIGILRKCWQTYRDDQIVTRCFYSFILPFFEYCSVVWMAAAPTHLNILRRAFTSAKFFVPAAVELEHRRTIAAVCILRKILNNTDHPMHSRLPGPAHAVRRTRRARRMNSLARVSAVSHNSSQFNRSFLPSAIEIWNFLPEELVNTRTMNSFKSKVNRHLLA